MAILDPTDDRVELVPPTAPIPHAPPPALNRDRNFVTYWFGQSLGALGDSIATISLPLLVLQTTGSVAQMGVITAILGVGRLVASFGAGVLVDRVDRRRLMMICTLLSAALFATIPLTWWLAGPHLWLLYAVSGPIAAVGMVQLVTSSTAVVNLVEREQLMDANGRLQVTISLSFIAGPVLAGLISAAFSPAGAILGESIAYIGAFTTLLFVRLRPSRDAAPQGQGIGAALAGMRFIFREPTLRWVIPLRAIVLGMLAGGLDLFIFRIRHDLHQGSSTVGIVFGLASLGGIGAGIIAPRLRRRFGFGFVFLGGLFIEGIVFVGFGVANSVIFAALLGISFVFSDTLSIIASMSLRQQMTPDALLGRVTATYQMLIEVGSPIGAALTTALAARAGAGPVMMGMGLCVLVMASVGSLTPARARDPQAR
jgi:predicted MFS family arabinose efflux permease